jgi:hypothetical protein
MAYQWGREWMRWRHWVKQPSQSIGGQEFLDLLSQCKFEKYRNELVRTIRIKGILAPTTEIEALVEDLAYTFERQQKLATMKMTREPLKKGSDNQLENQSELSNPTPRVST